MTNTRTGEVEERDILQVLSDMPHVVTEMTTELAKLLAAVDDTGRKGSISLTISVTPNKGNPDMKEVVGVVKTATPRRTPRTTIMYSQEDGTLARNDPSQISLFDGVDIKTVAAPAAPTKLKEAGQK
jgi:hypothetical protein